MYSRRSQVKGYDGVTDIVWGRFILFSFFVFFQAQATSKRDLEPQRPGLTAKPRVASRGPVDSGRFHAPREALAVVD